MGFLPTEHLELPRWMEAAPFVGSLMLAVPVAAQRNFEWPVVALVAAVAVVAFVDWRHVLPSYACTAGVLVGVALLLQSSDESDIAPFYLVALAAASAASRSPGQSLGVSAACVAVLVGSWIWYPESYSGLVIWVLGIVLAHVGGAGVRAQAALTSELRAAQLDLARRAAEDERQRIAREVHDLIAHSLTVTMLHLTGARLSLETGDPEEAAAALREAERLGLQSLGDIRRVVGVLGAPDAVARPQPSAGNIAALVDDYRAAGLEVDLDVCGDLASLSPATGLGLYRIVQEALANVGRHASGADARVAIDVGIDEIVLTVTNAVPVATAPARGGEGGFGVAGMRTRAQALRGSCTAGPAAGGEWEVRAVIPRDAE